MGTTELSQAELADLGCKGEFPGPRSRTVRQKIEAIAWSGIDYSAIPFVLKAKRGSYLFDIDGNTYIDMVTGWGSSPLGIGDERLLEPTVAALAQYGTEISDYVASEPVLALAEKLVEVSPASLTRVEFDISGTESVEMSMRLMRGKAERPFILSFFGQYHGESAGALGLGSQLAHEARYVRELTPGYIHVPYPEPYRCPFHRSERCDGLCVIDYIKEYILGYYSTADRIAGVIIEPVAGEAGVWIPPDPFWPALVELCQEHEWLLCADEVQSGIGRTGKMFAVEHWNVQPDLMCLAKSLSAGTMPIGATLGTEEVMGSTELYLGGTFAWTPAACVAALRGIDLIKSDNLLGHVGDLEQLLLERMGRWPAKYELVGDVRIKGLYIAVEFVADKDSKRRIPDFARRVHARSVRGGVAGIYIPGMSLLRWLPALNMSRETIEKAMDILEDSIVIESRQGL